MTPAQIRKVAQLFTHVVPDAAARLEGQGIVEMGWKDATALIQFCRKMYVDQRINDDDNFPLWAGSIEKASTNSILHAWGKGGRIHPLALSEKIREAKTDKQRTKLELDAVIETTEPVVRWYEMNNSTGSISAARCQAAIAFDLPIIYGTQGQMYLGQWEFDVAASPQGMSLVMSAAVCLYTPKIAERRRSWPQQ